MSDHSNGRNGLRFHINVCTLLSWFASSSEEGFHFNIMFFGYIKFPIQK